MEQKNYVFPVFNASSFNCLFCNAYANQYWIVPHLRIRVDPGNSMLDLDATKFRMSYCNHCKNLTIWVDEEIVYPANLPFVGPHHYMPDELRRDFEEARNIGSQSPRSACALLRLIIQKLCIILGEKGDNLNNDIGSLVKKGLPVKLQQSLDLVRVIGNNAIHPGLINIDDNLDVVKILFELINIIVDVMIYQPKLIEETYSKIIPPSQLDSIKKRDS